MTKRESIKEAYEKLGIPYNENVLFDGGWTKIKPLQFSSKYDDLDLLKLTSHVHSIRPKSLSGIENNNGWVKMNNKRDNLPTEHCKCWLWTKDGIMFGDYNSTTQGFYGYKEIKFSHYQIISEPKPPIY